MEPTEHLSLGMSELPRLYPKQRVKMNPSGHRGVLLLQCLRLLGKLPRKSLQPSERVCGSFEPPTSERAQIASLKAQSKKQISPTPGTKARFLLKKVAQSLADKMPCAPWAGATQTVKAVLIHHLTAAEDKAIGWTQHWSPGSRDNIRKDPQRVKDIVAICKVRLLLRCSWARHLHKLNPSDMVRRGLIDPVCTFVKKEGHSDRKAEEEAWRLIWNVSEPDRLLACSLHTDSDHGDVLVYQDPEKGREFPLAVGTGHDDGSLERTYRDLEFLMEKSPDGRVYFSDASGWDLSVSAATFWAAWEIRLQRAHNPVHRALSLISGYCCASAVACAGSNLFESCRFGITTSGQCITTNKNSTERAIGIKAARIMQEASIPDADALECVSYKELTALVAADQGAEKTTGDDEIDSHGTQQAFFPIVGTIIKKPKSGPVVQWGDGTPEHPIDYLSHLYFQLEGVWTCRYNNLAKLFHRVACLFKGDQDGRLSESQISKINDSVAGQLFAIRKCPDTVSAYTALIKELRSDYELPAAADNGCF